MDIIEKTLNLVGKEGLKEDLFYISKDPIPYRKLNLTLPGHEKNTLYEADDYIQSKLESWGYEVEKDEHNPLFVEDKPWEPRFDNLYANVLFDEEEQLYKCWYSPFIIDEGASITSHEKRLTISYEKARSGYTNVTDGAIEWRDGRDLSRFIGKPIRLQFELSAARLYAFGFSNM